MPTADSLARLKSTASTKSTRPAPTNPAPAIPVAPPSSGGGGSSVAPYSNYSLGGGGGGGGAAASFAPAAPPMAKGDWIAADVGYKAQRDALAKALADYQTNYDAELSQYDVDYNKGIRTLGYDSAVADDPNTPVDESKPAGWNLTDQNRSSGRAYQNQLNDFAGRNMLQSSAYGQAVNDLMRSLDEQRTGIDTARTNFRNDKQRAQTAYKTDNASQGNLAYADAASRYAALFGV